jgi:putative flippase GtrA
MTLSPAQRELGRFLIVGSLTVGVDYVCYRLAMGVGIDVNMAKALGFGGGTVFAYFANRFWTFSARVPATGSVWRFAAVYGVNLGVNVLLNYWVLQALQAHSFAIATAFLVATGTSSMLNFLGMKYLVFSEGKRKEQMA